MAATLQPRRARAETTAGYRRAIAAGFPPPMHHVVEVHGVCASCGGGQVPA